ncbi:MAG: hypothetical protein GYA41_10095 [Bacteroidales bacterium]|nr:hypothetical protein [Bacteroidales bacterium]
MVKVSYHPLKIKKTDPGMAEMDDEKRMEIRPETLRNLDTARKWTMFLSVFGFILTGLILVLALATGTFLAAFRPADTGPDLEKLALSFAFFLAVTLFFLSVLFLFRFSTCMRDAVQSHDLKKLDKAIKNLKLFFKFAGLILLTAIAVYVGTLIGKGSSLTFLLGM